MFMDLGRAQEILQRRKIDVALSSRPENVIHVSGVTDNLEFRFNKEERTYALVFPSEEPILVAQWFEVPHLRNRSHIKTIVPDQVWTSFPGNSKAVLQGDAEMTVAEIIRDHHLSSGRIGIDERAIPLAAFQKLRKNIPRATFVRATSIF